MAPSDDSYSPGERVLVYQARIIFPQWTWIQRSHFFNYCKVQDRPTRSEAGLVQLWARLKHDLAFLRVIATLPPIFSVGNSLVP